MKVRQNRPNSATVARASTLLSLVFLFLAMAACSAQPVINALSQVKKLYVETFSEGEEAAQLRLSLVRKLDRSGSYHVVDKPENADAIVKASGEVWVKGYLTINSRAPGSNREATYGGYLSVEVVAKDGEPLWSYLVTPSKLAWVPVRDDLANNLVKEMLVASKEVSTRSASAAPAQTLMRADLRGSGATFPEPLYRKWFASFQRLHPEVHIAYTANGSEAGTIALTAGKVDFAASDLSSDDGAVGQTGATFLRIPSVMGAVVPVFNVKGVNHDLRFTGELLADIYLGKVDKWNDPAIRNLNRDADLPNASIQVIHRSDGSGTTYAWSQFLSNASVGWKQIVGADAGLQWPAGKGVAGNEGVATAVQQMPNSIGYVELVYAIQHRLSYGSVRNTSGEYVRADLDSLSEAADAMAANRSGKKAYPIVTYTWLLIPQQTNDTAKRSAMLSLLRWALTSGQKECSSLGYVPLPRDVAAQQLEIVNKLK